MFLFTEINGYYIEYPHGGHFDYQSGLTVIRGGNRKGKSSQLEVGMRYALFGTEALRRPASDYKTLSVRTGFVVNGVRHCVIRNPKGTSLWQATERDGINEFSHQIATGTTAVNKAIIRILGYDLKTFDITNCCNQNQVMAFSDNMKPAERKKLIDQTLGLSCVDTVIEELADEAKGINASLKGMTSVIGVEPVEPMKPEWYVEKDQLETMKFGLEQNQLAYNRLIGIANQPLVAPDWSKLNAMVKSELTLAEIETEIKGFEVDADYVAKLRAIKNPVALVEPVEPVLKASVDALIASTVARPKLNTALIDLDRLEFPEYEPEQLKVGLKIWESIKEFDLAQALKLKGETDCPNCKHHFFLAHEQLSKVETVGERPLVPTITEAQIQRALTLWEVNTPRQIELIKTIEVLKPQVIEGDLVELQKYQQYTRDLNQYRLVETQYHAQLKAFEDAQVKLTEGLAQYGKEPSDCLKEARQTYLATQLYLQTEALLKRQQEAYDTLLLTVQTAKVELEKLNFDPANYTTFQNLYHEHIRYDEQVKSYLKAKETYDKNLTIMDGLKVELEDIAKARKALLDFKMKVKGYILPSLNKVASALINTMTGGELYECSMDDDYEIFINKKPLASQSGSGKAVGNIALRLALGQVLTNKVFSVFMGDEVDASMDDANAKYLMDCFQNLKSSISQIILVTHKTELEGDHYISL